MRLGLLRIAMPDRGNAPGQIELVRCQIGNIALPQTGRRPEKHRCGPMSLKYVQQRLA
jgi:hypothetical protein